MIQQTIHKIENYLWRQRPAAPRAAEQLRRFSRYPYALLRDALEGQLTMRAMSLVYTTLLSLVPLIALSFSTLKAFDVHYQIEPLLARFLAPLGELKAQELAEQVTEFVENVGGLTLTSVGLVLLLYTVFSMVQKIEESVNYVWQVERTRSLTRRFSEYLSVIIVAPVFMLVAVGLVGAIFSHTLAERLLANEWISETVLLATQLMPFALATGIFMLVYAFVPNTSVRLSAAFVGGLSAGAMWLGSGALFASFVAGSARYTAIYTTFAAVIIALIWMYISWLILLIGAKISFYFQNPEYLRYGHRPVQLNSALRERIAIQMMALVGEDFVHHNHEFTINSLAEYLGLPGRGIAPIAQNLEKSGLLLTTENERLVPGRAIDTITVNDILTAIRHRPTLRHLPLPLSNTEGPVDLVLTDLHNAIAESVKGKTLADLIRR